MQERTGFDSHLKSLEETMRGKDKDHEDLEILARDAVASRDASRNELETLRIEYEDFVRWTEDQLHEQRAKVLTLEPSIIMLEPSLDHRQFQIFSSF